MLCKPTIPLHESCQATGIVNVTMVVKGQATNVSNGLTPSRKNNYLQYIRQSVAEEFLSDNDILKNAFRLACHDGSQL